MRSARWLIDIGMLGMVMGVGVPGVHAQVSLVRAGSFEVGPFVGASYGIDQFRGMGGGNVTFAINKYILPYAEYSYFPGIGRTTTTLFPGTQSSFTQVTSYPLSDFHGGVHIRFPIHESPVVPYAVIGLGGLRQSARMITINYKDINGNPATAGPLPVPAQTDFTVNFGGGIRYYLSQRYGIRVEAKGYRPSGGSANPVTSSFGKVEFGFFFQLR
jgi:hypothetical protein